jgi:tetratricopeptide (TPR) repeat protein
MLICVGIAIPIAGLAAVAIFFVLGSIGINIESVTVIAGIPLILMSLIFALMLGGSFVLEAALLEGLSSRAAVSCTFALVKNNWRRVGGTLFVLCLITLPINIILGNIPGPGQIIGSMLTTPFFAIGHILLYYDLRLRKEGYTVETLAGKLNIKPDVRITKVWEDLSNEAFTLYQRGQCPEAVQRLQDALKAAQLVLGPEHPDVAEILENMAKCYKKMGSQHEANKLEERARQIRSKH